MPQVYSSSTLSIQLTIGWQKSIFISGITIVHICSLVTLGAKNKSMYHTVLFRTLFLLPLNRCHIWWPYNSPIILKCFLVIRRGRNNVYLCNGELWRKKTRECSLLLETFIFFLRKWSWILASDSSKGASVYFATI